MTGMLASSTMRVSLSDLSFREKLSLIDQDAIGLMWDAEFPEIRVGAEMMGDGSDADSRGDLAAFVVVADSPSRGRSACHVRRSCEQPEARRSTCRRSLWSNKNTASPSAGSPVPSFLLRTRVA